MHRTTLFPLCALCRHSIVRSFVLYSIGCRIGVRRHGDNRHQLGSNRSNRRTFRSDSGIRIVSILGNTDSEQYCRITIEVRMGRTPHVRTCERLSRSRWPSIRAGIQEHRSEYSPLRLHGSRKFPDTRVCPWHVSASRSAVLSV